MRILRITLITAVVSLVGAFASTGADLGCVADGHPAFQEGSQSWCDLGIFERVHVDYNEEKDRLRAYVDLNVTGRAMYDESSAPFFTSFGKVLHNMALQGVDAEMQFRDDGEILGTCRTFKEVTEVKTVCKPFEGSSA